MTLVDAKETFIAFLKDPETDSGSLFQDTSLQNGQTNAALPDRIPVSLEALECSLDLLIHHFPNLEIADLTDARLRDFLACWYVEEATVKATSKNPASLPDAQPLIISLQKFFQWEGKALDKADAAACFAVLNELQKTLPRAIAIGIALSQVIADRGGPFTHPEFLTSFEEGGQSQYDIDEKGETHSREGYFRIIKVGDDGVEAEELILEERIAPIIFPTQLTPLLREGYIINLELLKTRMGWQVRNCGFAYPPNTEI